VGGAEKFDDYTKQDVNFLIEFICRFENITNLIKKNSIDFVILGMISRTDYRATSTYGVQTFYKKNSLTFVFSKENISIAISLLEIKINNLYDLPLTKIIFNEKEVNMLDFSIMFESLSNINTLRIEFTTNIEDESYNLICFNDKWTYGIQKPTIIGAPDD
jgi:hypothetical protein